MNAKHFVNPDIQWAPFKDRYAQTGRVLVNDFLDPAAAAELSTVAKSSLPWVLQYRDGGKTHQMDESRLRALKDEERRAFLARIEAVARADFQFWYFGCSLSPSNVQQFQHDHPVRSLVAKIVTPEFVSLLRNLIGDSAVCGLTASFTRYDPGQFLLPHDDTDSTDDRRAAYVLNLSEDWWPDWGGLLQFIDDKRNVVETFSPHFGSIAVFKVPQLHAVSYVTPFALRSRFAITGWLIA